MTDNAVKITRAQEVKLLKEINNLIRKTVSEKAFIEITEAIIDRATTAAGFTYEEYEFIRQKPEVISCILSKLSESLMSHIDYERLPNSRSVWWFDYL